MVAVAMEGKFRFRGFLIAFGLQQGVQQRLRMTVEEMFPTPAVMTSWMHSTDLS